MYPVVVGVSHPQMSLILVAIAIAVADKRSLVMIVDVRVRDGHVVGGVRDIQQT